MKILHIMAGGEHGGAETAFVDMSIAMHLTDQTIEVVTRPNDVRVHALEAAGVKVHSLPFGGKFDFYTSWQIRRIIKSFQPDIVQGWMSRACQHIPQWSKTMSVPRYLTVARFGTPYKLKYYNNMQYFVALTPDIQSYLEQEGVAKSCLTQIPNFAEVELVKTPINRADFDTPEKATLVLGLGRLHPDKAFDTLIDVAAKLPDIYVWIAGEGPQRAELEQQIARLNLTERVKLLGWRTDRAAILQAADICAFISRNEGFGTVFIQSWAQQTPLLVSDADGPRQFVQHDINGLVAPIDDVEAIAAGVERLRKDPELADRLSCNGFERFQNGFTKSVIVSAYIDYYRAIRQKEALD